VSKGTIVDGYSQSEGYGAQPSPIYSGVFTHSLDPKKRLTIPVDWRIAVGRPEKVFVMPGFDGEPCLYVFPMRVMAARLEAVSKALVSDPNYRVFTRTMGENSAEVPWDSQGRIRIPDHLLLKGGLVSEVYMLGAKDRFELWNPENRKQYRDEKEGTITLSQAAKLLGF
jgi:MraZ protein